MDSSTKDGALFCGGIYRDIVAVASRFPGNSPFIFFLQFDLHVKINFIIRIDSILKVVIMSYLFQLKEKLCLEVNFLLVLVEKLQTRL